MPHILTRSNIRHCAVFVLTLLALRCQRRVYKVIVNSYRNNQLHVNRYIVMMFYIHICALNEKGVSDRIIYI